MSTDESTQQIDGIINSSSNRIHIIAGPGTGKTTTLESRVAQLLYNGQDPKRILAISFTRSSARDLQLHLQGLDIPGAEKINVGTLHSYALQWLFEYGALGDTENQWRLIEDYEIKGLLHDLTQMREFGDKRACEKLWSELTSAWAPEPDDEPGPAMNEQQRRFEEEVQRWLRIHHCMHIAQAVPKALDLVIDNPTLGLYNRYDHIIVDEFQDLNRSDQALIQYISIHSNLIIAGDDDQSIYRELRHAHPDGIIDYSTQYPDSEEYHLSLCWRCPTDLIQPANALIQRNDPHRLPKQLEPREDNPDGIIHNVQFLTRQRETQGIADYIRYRYTNEGDDYLHNTIILTSCRKILGSELKNNLDNGNPYIPSILLKSGSKDVPDVLKKLTLLRQAASPGDLVSLRTWLGLHMSQYCRVQYQDLLSLTRDGNILWDVITDELAGDNCTCSSKMINLIRQFLDESGEIRRYSGSELIEYLFPSDNNIYNDIRKVIEDFDTNIEEIQCDEFCTLIHDRLRDSFFSSNTPTLRIMTFFEAKGLTSKNVIIIGASKGLVPRGPRKNRDPNIVREEQRRLFYVSLTRAKKELIISNFKKIQLSEAKQLQLYCPRIEAHQWCVTTSSPFLRELGRGFPRVIPEEDFRTLFVL